MFEEQLRKDIAKVIETGGEIEKWGRNRIRFTFDQSDYVPEDLFWKVVKGTATRTAYDSGYDVFEKKETDYMGVSVANASDLMKLIKTILNPIKVRKPQSDDIPF